MIDYTQIWDNGKYKHVRIDGMWNAITEEHYPAEYAEMMAYLAEHPEALVSEPVPPPPTPEQLLSQEMQQLLAYLASTDWYAIRKTMSGKAIPQDVLDKCEAARQRISQIKMEFNK